jgi:hypothetical protein
MVSMSGITKRIDVTKSSETQSGTRIHFLVIYFADAKRKTMHGVYMHSSYEEACLVDFDLYKKMLIIVFSIYNRHSDFIAQNLSIATAEITISKMKDQPN